MVGHYTLKFIDHLKCAEGFSSRPYKCPAGKLTIGYGRNLEARGITVSEAEYLLENDADDAWAAAQCFAGERWPAPDLTDARAAALASLAFNVGAETLSAFTRLRAAVRAGKYRTAAAEMLNSAWAKQVPARAALLASWMRTGCW